MISRGDHLPGAGRADDAASSSRRSAGVARPTASASRRACSGASGGQRRGDERVEREIDGIGHAQRCPRCVRRARACYSAPRRRTRPISAPTVAALHASSAAKSSVTIEERTRRNSQRAADDAARARRTARSRHRRGSTRSTRSTAASATSPAIPRRVPAAPHPPPRRRAARPTIRRSRSAATTIAATIASTRIIASSPRGSQHERGRPLRAARARTDASGCAPPRACRRATAAAGRDSARSPGLPDWPPGYVAHACSVGPSSTTMRQLGPCVPLPDDGLSVPGPPCTGSSSAESAGMRSRWWMFA